VLVALLPTICRAKTACPWINEATAFGVLGGSANSPTNLSEISPTTCNFTYKDTAASRNLLITVEVMKVPGQAIKSYEARCTRSMNPLRAIGNEAVMCETDRKGYIYGEQIIGRVRDSVFTISMSTSAENDPSMAREALEQKVKLVAEQVAGNLF